MKKHLILSSLLALSLSLAQPLSAQPAADVAPTEELVAGSTNMIEAYSDTTSVTDADSSQKATVTVHVATPNGYADRFVERVISQLDVDDLAGLFFVLLIVFIVFVLSPVVIFGLIVYLVLKSRNQRMRLAEMSMQTGQPIPQEALERNSEPDDLRTKGIRQLMLGMGLMVFLGYSAGKIGFGLGVLVACIGLGKLIIWRNNNNNSPSNNL